MKQWWATEHAGPAAAHNNHQSAWPPGRDNDLTSIPHARCWASLVGGMTCVVGGTRGLDAGEVVVGPVDQLVQDRVEAAAPVGEGVLHPWRDGRIHGSSHEAVAFEVAQGGAEHALGDALGQAEELVEASRLAIQTADHDHRPLVADPSQ